MIVSIAVKPRWTQALGFALGILVNLILPPLAAAPAPSRFEVVATTRSSDPTLANWVVARGRNGAEVLVMAFRRDEFIVVVNFATGECRQHFLSPGMPWSLTPGKDGSVYIGTSLSPGARLLRYDPLADRVETIAKAEGEQILYWMEASADGLIYAGSYPGARLYRYSPETREFKNLGRIDPIQTYNISGAVPESGKIYCGIGMTKQGIIEYDVKTGATRNIWPEQWAGPSAPKVYRGRDGLVYATPGSNTEASKGKALRISADSTVEQIPLRAAAPYDHGHRQFSDAGQPVLSDGSAIVEVTREKIVLQPWGGRGTSRTIPLQFEPLVKEIFSIGLGPRQKIYGTSKPAVMFSYDPATGTMSDLVKVSPKVGQVYRYVESGGKLYMGSYGHAEFHVFDPAQPGTATRTIGKAGAYQDRPVDMVADSKGVIYAACYPGYGERGGALTRFNPKTETFENFRNVIPQESLNALALDEENLRLFIGSSNVAGNGVPPSTRDAEVALWDLAARRITARVTPVPGEKVISALLVVPGGTVCGQTQTGKWFTLDAATLAVRFVHQLDGPAPNLARLVYDPKRGMVYGMAGGSLWRASAANLRPVENLGRPASKAGPVNYGVEIDPAGAIYFAQGKQLIKWSP